MSFLPREFEVPEVVETERFRLRSITIHDAFKDYDAVMSLDERRLLGCVYVDPPGDAGTDAEIWYGARQSELTSGLEVALEGFLVSWLAGSWAFTKVNFNGKPGSLLGGRGA